MLPVLLFLTLQPSTCFFQKTKIILLYPLQHWCLISEEMRNIKCESYVIVVKCKYSSLEWVAFVDIHFHTDLVASCGQQDKGLVWDTELFRSPPLHFFLKSLNKQNKQTNKQKTKEFSRTQRSSGLLCWFFPGNLTSIKQ